MESLLRRRRGSRVAAGAKVEGRRHLVAGEHVTAALLYLLGLCKQSKQRLVSLLSQGYKPFNGRVTEPNYSMSKLTIGTIAA